MDATIVEGPPPAAPPAPTSEIHVTPQTIDTGPQPDAPKPGSAKERMFASLRAKAKPEGQTAAPPAQQDVKPAAKPVAKTATAKPATEATPPEGEQTPPEGEQAAVPEGTKPAAEKPMTAEEKKRVNPWKLVDQYKSQTSKLQEEITKLRTSALPEKERTELASRIEKAEARAKALEDHMRFVDYSKSEEFQQKYQQPYEAAWTRAMDELKELVVGDSEGNSRPIQAQDILDLVNLPLPKARELAEQNFGPFANDVMAHRKEIRNLFEAQSRALEDAKKNGADRVKQMTEQQQKAMGEMQKLVKETWDAANDSIVRDEKYGLYFTPVEGDENVNQRLAKGYELVDRAFAENPNNPQLSADERRAIIKRHAAVRNRAAAFGRLVYDLNKAQQTINELNEELKQFRGSSPGTGGSPKATSTETAHTSARDSVFAALRAKAH